MGRRVPTSLGKGVGAECIDAPKEGKVAWEDHGSDSIYAFASPFACYRPRGTEVGSCSVTKRPSKFWMCQSMDSKTNDQHQTYWIMALFPTPEDPIEKRFAP